MKTLVTFLACSFLCISSLFSQQTESLFGHRGIHLTGVWGGYVHGLAEYANNYNQNRSGYFTFEINNDILVGWSGYGSATTFENDTQVEIGGNDLLVGYLFNSGKVVHPVIYLKGGGGSLKINGEEKDKITVFNPSVGAEINITSWFRLGVEGGYRFVTNVDSPDYDDTDFSSPIVGLRLKFGLSWR